MEKLQAALPSQKSHLRLATRLAGVVVAEIVRAALQPVAIRGPVLKRSPFAWEEHLRLTPDKKFRRMCRMSKGSFRNLAMIVKPQLARKGRLGGPSVDHRIMLGITIRYLAGTSYLDIGWPYGVSDPFVYEAIKKVLAALSKSLENIRFPTSEGEGGFAFSRPN